MKAAYDSRPVTLNAATDTMKTHRLYTPETLEVGEKIVLQGQAAHYLSRVLRLADNTEVMLFNGDGHDYRCELYGFDRDSVRIRVQQRLSNDSISPLRITLVQAMSRGDRMDYSLQKATELGVAAVQLLVTERVELKLVGARLEKRLAHWRGVIQSACEQCGRATLPELREPVTIAEWLALPDMKLVLDAGGDCSLSQVEPDGGIDIAVGPEGGFSDEEIELMKRSGVQRVRMGPRILRTETAGPAAIAVVQSIAGDMS